MLLWILQIIHHEYSGSGRRRQQDRLCIGHEEGHPLCCLRSHVFGIDLLLREVLHDYFSLQTAHDIQIFENEVVPSCDKLADVLVRTVRVRAALFHQ